MINCLNTQSLGHMCYDFDENDGILLPTKFTMLIQDTIVRKLNMIDFPSVMPLLGTSNSEMSMVRLYLWDLGRRTR